MGFSAQFRLVCLMVPTRVFLCSFELGPLGLGFPLGLGVLRDFLWKSGERLCLACSVVMVPFQGLGCRSNFGILR